MKRFIKKCLLLSVIMLVVVLILNYFSTAAGDHYKDGAAMVCETKREMVRSGAIGYMEGRRNVLFMGTSRILAGVQPEYFDRLGGGRTYSYNLALPALPISPAYFILKDYLMVNPAPEHIVMELYARRCRTCTLNNYFSVQGISGLSEAATLVRYAQNKSILLNILFSFRMYKFFLPKYVFNGVLRPSRLEQVAQNNGALLEKMKRNRGYYYIAEQAVEEEQRLTEALKKQERAVVKMTTLQDPFYDPYVEKFFDLAAQHGIRVMLIQAPYLKGKYLQFEEMPPAFRAVMDRYSNVFMAPGGWKLNFYDYRLFADQDHLSEEGASHYTEEIYNQFNGLF
ncbi:MAG: hypothetical protein GY940_00640 [bacterium]|nr:hypothetical protein [bacterium]